jgi:hypothetical protein
MAQRVVVGFSYDLQIIVGAAGGDGPQQVGELPRREYVGRELLAQRRHV